MSCFEKISDFLKARKESPEIHVPGLWVNNNYRHAYKIKAHEFYQQQFEIIEQNTNQDLLKLTPLPLSKYEKPKWINTAITYNLLVRFFTAFDHDQDGKLGEGKTYLDNQNGIREVGTLLKTIALLPYLKKLGVNTLHLLPLTPIGKDGRKGDLGSPYAVKNHFEIDPTIVDPFVPFSGEEQLSALVEACHGLGIRVVMEFILRTSAKDADWIPQHPDWYYWIKESTKKFKAPEFGSEELKKIKKVAVGKDKYIEPNSRYQNLFMPPPPLESINYDDHYRGMVNNTKVKIPSAFADWPPDDPQPPWTDVTYLKFYTPENQKFNYIAYNTIRYYDPRLEKEENINKKLWQTLTGLIPHYQKKCGIDGVMIDMGHALPEKFKNSMLEKAKEINPDFAFWDEKFDEDKNPNLLYDAIIGNIWYLASRRKGHEKILNKVKQPNKLFFFACAETHNSPRFAYDKTGKKMQMWLLLNLLPKAMPFIHQGFELNEWIPVNTGLNINAKLQEKLAGKPLPLFNKSSLEWNSSKNIVNFIGELNSFRANNSKFFSSSTETTVDQIENSKIFIIKKMYSEKALTAIFNFDQKNSVLIDADDFNLRNRRIQFYNGKKWPEISDKKWKLPPSGFVVVL